MKKFQYSTQLDDLAAQLRGIPPMASINANVYFVMTDGHVILATTLYNTADYVFQQIVMAGQQSAVLADRRFGDVATYYPAKGMVIDMRMEDYYQQQKVGAD